VQSQTQRHASADRLREATAAVAATAQDQQGHDGSGRLSCRLAQQQPCGWLERLSGCRCPRSSPERSVDRPPRKGGLAGCCLEVRVGGLVGPSGSHAGVPCLELRTRLGKRLSSQEDKSNDEAGNVPRGRSPDGKMASEELQDGTMRHSARTMDGERFKLPYPLGFGFKTVEKRGDQSSGAGRMSSR